MAIEKLVERKNKLECQIDSAVRAVLFYEGKIAEHEQYGESLRNCLGEAFKKLMPLQREKEEIELKIKKVDESQ